MGVVLVREFGQQGWILQAMEACREAVQNCIELLSGSAPPVNNQPLGHGGQYAFPARTAEELRATAAQAAHAGQVSAANVQQQRLAEQAEQALANGEVDMFAALQKQAGLADPASQPQPKKEASEWIL